VSPDAQAQAEAGPGNAVAPVEGFGWALGTLMRAYLKAAADAVAYFPSGPRGYQVLEVAAGLSENGLHPNQAMLAERLGMDRTAMTYLLDELERQKLIVRRPDPADRRSRLVTLTAKGGKALETLGERVREAERRVLSGLSNDEVAALNGLLSRAAAGSASPRATSACELAAQAAEQARNVAPSAG
jgi:DNA-binding MarR family transcriptional regulator